MIAEYRRRADLTQSELAEKVGTSPAYISQLETGYRRASMPMLVRLAAVLGCNPADLLQEVSE